MNGSADVSTQHRQVWNLLPWVINGRASDAECVAVEAHLADCIDCREEYEFQKCLREAVAWDNTEERNPQPALHKLWTRIDSGIQAAPSARTPPQPAALIYALAATVVIEAVGLYALGGMPWLRDAARAPAMPYRTLSSAPASSSRATLRVVLAPALTLAEFQKLLQASRLQIVGGPSEAGVYSLAPVASSDAAPAPTTNETLHALAQLRASPDVRFAEPVADASGPAR